MLPHAALDKLEYVGMPIIADLIDIVEMGTPLLECCGVSALAAARELAPDTRLLVDTKTVDGDGLEADLVFGSGAAMRSVPSAASPATVCRSAPPIANMTLVTPLSHSPNP